MPALPVLLLVGGTGFVGSYLAPELAMAFPGHRRVLMTRSAATIAPAGWDVVQADIRDEKAVGEVLKNLRPALIFHLAAQSAVTGDREETWRANFGGTFNLAVAAKRHAPEGTFFFASSGEVYGRSFNLGPATEDTCPQPLNAYAASKRAAEAMLQDILPASARLIIARAFNHTGPGQDERFVLPAFAAQIARIEAGHAPPVIKVGNLDAERDFLDVRDVVDAYVKLLQTSVGERHLVNVASGTARRIRDVLDALLSLSATSIRIEIDSERLRPSDIPRAVGDTAKLRALTGWSPQRDFATTIQDVLGWWRGRVTS